MSAEWPKVLESDPPPSPIPDGSWPVQTETETPGTEFPDVEVDPELEPETEFPDSSEIPEVIPAPHADPPAPEVLTPIENRADGPPLTHSRIVTETLQWDRTQVINTWEGPVVHVGTSALGAVVFISTTTDASGQPQRFQKRSFKVTEADQVLVDASRWNLLGVLFDTYEAEDDPLYARAVYEDTYYTEGVGQ